MSNCIYHKDCPVDWMKIYQARKSYEYKSPGYWSFRSIGDHMTIQEAEESTEPDEVIGPLTAMAKIHKLRQRKEYDQADALREQWDIHITQKGYEYHLDHTKRGIL